MKSILSSFALTLAASALTIEFSNQCDFPIWAAIGSAPWGNPDPSIVFGQKIAHNGGKASYKVSDMAVGIRAWGRTGCDDNGDSCETGGCNGGLICTDAGITSGVIVSEYGYANFGPNYGGERTSWDLSHVNLSVNIPTRVMVTDGQSVACTSLSCAADEAYSSSADYAADRNSPLGQTYTHVFCP
ncbi:Osmotin thaumatin-like protein [Vararia minispora EC-137]|uniref:Osmotin thaumatin-like protein n=1 Tax=Vararia minispora EC-137 TaxID=1314806 RepID=A0ACB8QB08_9AGAM|nr:Osmotin thaumatin-like protein [Vararia minispora EC-137]